MTKPSTAYSIQGASFQARPIPDKWKDTICDDTETVFMFIMSLTREEINLYPLSTQTALVKLAIEAVKIHELYHATLNQRMN